MMSASRRFPPPASLLDAARRPPLVGAGQGIGLLLASALTFYLPLEGRSIRRTPHLVRGKPDRVGVISTPCAATPYTDVRGSHA
jgi:hypothetical protein